MMCFVKNNLVLRGEHLSTGARCFKAFNDESGNLTGEWKPQCQHHIEFGSFITSRIFSETDEEDLVEGCPECRVIRVYDGCTEQAKTICENLEPNTLCHGPDGSILVWEGRTKRVLQLTYKGKKPNLIQRLGPFDWRLLAMCYTKHCDTVILLTFIGNLTTLRIRGFNLTTGQLGWQVTSSLNDAPLNPEDGLQHVRRIGLRCTWQQIVFPWIRQMGCIVETVLENESLGSISEVVCSTDAKCKIAMRHGPYNREISCYAVSFKSGNLSVPRPLTIRVNYTSKSSNPDH